MDAGRENNYSVGSPDATVFEVGLGKERIIWGEELGSGDRVGFAVGEPGVLGTVRDYGTYERFGFGRAREGVGRSVRGAGDVSELDIVGLDVGKPTNHAGRKVGRGFPATKRDVVGEGDNVGSSPK